MLIFPGVKTKQNFYNTTTMLFNNPYSAVPAVCQKG